MEFFKMHGLGNDYVYIDCTKSGEPKNINELAVTLSNRHFGVGSDGVILICNSDKANLKMRMFNSDGSEAQMCGNGIRCVAKLAYELNICKKEELTIETLAGIKKLKLNVNEGKVKTIEVDMGEPVIYTKSSEKDAIRCLENEIDKFEVPIIVNGKELKCTCVSMGNPHAIIFVDDVKNFPVEKYGPIIEKDKKFPERANVEFVEVVDKNNIKMRVWERGAGETLACGTGACASVVASSLKEFTERKVTVELLGGNLEIEWKDNNHVYMTGPAVTVFKGEWINS